MTTYFSDEESIYYRFGDDPARVLKVLAEHYIGNNPETPFIFRAFNKTGILQNDAGQFDLDFRSRFPGTPLGYFAYACALVWSDAERNIDLSLVCYGPIRFYLNSALLFRSGAVDEVGRNPVKVEILLKPGWNTLALAAQNTSAGFGCRIGAEEAKVRILNVLSPFAERRGQAGWVYSEPVPQDPFDELPVFDSQMHEAENGLTWHPRMDWAVDARQAHRSSAACERIFGVLPGKKAYAWAKADLRHQGRRVFSLRGRTDGPLVVWLNDMELLRTGPSERFDIEFEADAGVYDVLVETECGEESWQWEVGFYADELPCSLLQPHRIHGYDGAWIYLGWFEESLGLPPKELRALHKVMFNRYWRCDLPNTWIRPYCENAMLSNKWTTFGTTNFARWDYPLGVTMYGLLQTGRLLGRRDIIDYALHHIQICTRFYDYSLWDREQYGFPSLNHQLVLIRMLDNCGSFGSAMLEAYKEDADEHSARIAHVIAEFISKQLERREDGAFYRICAGEYSENSMWADDLYMSTPFMRRYSEFSGDRAFLDDAARQFLLYKKYLFMPEQRIMSHVYDFKYNTATYVPWGRGNGWTIFSLSELLEALPEDHALRPQLVEFFNELCSGYLALQAESGMWRQVLNDPDAYEEASCTAMFVYAFSRGVYKGWLSDGTPYVHAALKGWSALTKKAIDRHGNVHGVCSGSRYAFHAGYYKEDLRTVMNDNHGIGIMMLAGVEVMKMQQRLRGESI